MAFSPTLGLGRAVVLSKKSGIKSFRTGAVIFDKKGVISEGWSHNGVLQLTRYRSIHAEVHAILRAPRESLRGASISVATIRGKSGNVGLGKPCLFCQELLFEVGINRVWYTIEGDKFGHFDLEVQHDLTTAQYRRAS